ncbi:hypothetical protein K3555_13705 [Leisingera sp. M527]|uniref:hypothetical protein n=1 Tax=Leisingera sp. M527 TaxID=2867014 RepID=UPI0021A34297|nr:hypothetical protein [Leisingera sp. M527]UWQ31648.1 hypothetical protein K3555_13705 [Leisingera sp. M527]
MSDDQKTRPVETLRDGNIKASVWENTRDGKTNHNVQFRRSYRGEDGQYRDTDSFAANDLLRLSRLAEHSYDAVSRLREHQREGQPRDGQENRRTRGRDRDRDR